MTSYLKRLASARLVHRAGIPLLLITAVLITFRGVLGHEFVLWDDQTNIVNNENIREISPASLFWMFTDTSYAPRYMPLGWLCYAMDREFFGSNSETFHAGNLLIHTINALLLYFLLRKLIDIGRGINGAQSGNSIGRIAACLGALFWAINPLRVEVVAWASCRIFNVALLFALLWLLAWIHSRTTPSVRAARSLSWLSLLALTASLLTYPIAVFGWAILFLLDVYPLRRFSMVGVRNHAELRKLVVEKMPFLLISAAILAIAVGARLGGGGGLPPISTEKFGLFDRLMQATYVVVYYAWKPFLPLSLAASYPTLHSFDPMTAPFILSAFVIVGVATAALLCVRRTQLPLILLACHVTLLVPVLGLSEYPHTPHDRYSHFPSLLLSGAIGIALARLPQWGNLRKLGISTLAAACLVLAWLSLAQVPMWQNSLELYTGIVERHGNHPSRARFEEVVAVEQLRAGQTKNAITSLKQAAHFDRVRADRHIYETGVATRCEQRLAGMARESGDFNAAAEHYIAAIAAEHVQLYAVRITIDAAELLLQINRAREAIPLLRRALITSPNNGTLHKQLGTALEKLGEHAEATTHFEEERRLRLASLQGSPGPGAK